ncbi:MAG: 3-phosphoshikimate 1-carboxyvinyltransferase [Candidatus Omnitrophota bacterium]|nr:3-phosphoshikimate 1-carboxyvinyltransferase [Candidatus Omnitrophota bacterium]
MDWKIKKAAGGLKGELTVPPDKSISHRAVMFAAISGGSCRVRNFLFSEDCMRTLEAFRAMGVNIEKEDDSVIIHGRGLKGLKEPPGELYLGNSGTTMRIISGILAGQSFSTRLTGDESLSKRPMLRIKDPLLEMGADIDTFNGNFPPVSIRGRKGPLKAIDYKTSVASAQVKSCILAAGLYADGQTSITEPFQSRDHTERMLEYFSADIEREGLTTRIKGLKELAPKDIRVPGDISSAAYFIVGGSIVKGSDLVIKNAGLNSTRRGLITVLERMGADIELLDVRGDVEPAGDIRVRSSDLKGTVVEAEEIPLLIDEVPVLMIAAVMAEGRTEIKGISELKVKESDRIKSMRDNFLKLDVDIHEEGNSLVIYGGVKVFSPASLKSFGDHRIAMSMAVAALVSGGDCSVCDTECVDTSYPGFLADLEKVMG